MGGLGSGGSAQSEAPDLKLPWGKLRGQEHCVGQRHLLAGAHGLAIALHPQHSDRALKNVADRGPMLPVGLQKAGLYLPLLPE